MHCRPLTVLLLVALPPAATGGQTLIVANKSEASVSLVDLTSALVVATLPTGEAPHEVAVSPSGALALISNYGTRESPGSTLTLLEVERSHVVSTIDLAPHRRPHGVVFRDERLALVTAEDEQALLEVDVAAGTVVRAIATGQEVSHMVAVTPDGSRAFVANIGSGSITAIDLAAGTRIADVATGEGAEGIDVSPDGARVYVTNRAADTVSTIDAKSLAVLATTAVAAFPIRARVTPGGAHLLVTCARSGDLAVLDPASSSVARRVPFELAGRAEEGRLMRGFGDSSVPIGVVVEPGGRRAYVAHANADAISVVDLEAMAVVGDLSAGKEPDGMAWSPLAAAPPAPNAFGARLIPRGRDAAGVPSQGR